MLTSFLSTISFYLREKLRLFKKILVPRQKPYCKQSLATVGKHAPWFAAVAKLFVANFLFLKNRRFAGSGETGSGRPGAALFPGSHPSAKHSILGWTSSPVFA